MILEQRHNSLEQANNKNVIKMKKLTKGIRARFERMELITFSEEAP
jgi:hypothetical protein